MSEYTPGDAVDSLVSGQHFVSLRDKAAHWGEKIADASLFGGGSFDTSLPRAYTGQQNFTAASLSDGANIAWNLNTQQVAAVTLAGNRTLSNPTNMVNGGTYILIVKQDATGSRTLSYGANYKWAGGVTPVLSTAANAVDVLTFVSDGTNMYGTIQKGFA